MAGNFIALCNENEEAPLVVIAGRETFVISLLTRIGYGGQFCCDAHRGALNVLPMTARHPVSCPSMCGDDQIRGSMRCGISGPLWSADDVADHGRNERHARQKADSLQRQMAVFQKIGGEPGQFKRELGIG
jgi:hypothetical protein